MRARSAAWWVWALGVVHWASCGGQTSETTGALNHLGGAAGMDSAGAANGGAGGDSGGRTRRDASVEAHDSAGPQGTGGDGFECDTSYDCAYSRSDAGAFRSCEPGTGRCVPPCSGWAREFDFAEPTVPCASNQRCVMQEREFRLYVGACYSECDWSTGGEGCPPGFACGRRTTSIDRCPPGFDCTLAGSICKRFAAAGPGGKCFESDTSTGCAAGYYCQGSVCRSPCDFWSAAPSCASGEHCAMVGAPEGFPGICDVAFSQDAQLGEACTVYAAHCASDGKAWRGECMDACPSLNCPSGPRLCLKHCRTNADCPSDFPTCTATVCAPAK